MPVRLVSSRRDLAAFIELPFRLQGGDPAWVPPLRREIRGQLDRRHNPFFEYGDAAYFLAERDGAVVGRIAAIANRLHDETHGDGRAFFGFFETMDDADVAAELVAAASRWAAERGYGTLRGPASFSVNHEFGLLVDGFDTPPTPMMPHNPPYYGPRLEDAGLVPVKDLLAYEGGTESRWPPPPDRATRAVELVRRRLDLTIRPVNIRRFGDEVATVREIFNACWKDNWGFVPLSPADVRHMASTLKPLVIPDLVPIIEREGRPIACALAIPDVHFVLRRHRSGRLFPAVPDLLWSLWRRRIPRIRILLLGVLPEYRGRGVDALVFHWIWTRARKYNVTWGEAGWILEDNTAMRNALERMTFREYKRFRVYERPL